MNGRDGALPRLGTTCEVSGLKGRETPVIAVSARAMHEKTVLNLCEKAARNHFRGPK